MDKTNKIIHKRSSVILENGKAKLPTTDQLEYGELAINFAKGAETISFKNNNDEIVSITTSTTLEGIIESNMQNVQASIDAINQTIEENEEIVATALTNLDERIKSTVEVIDGIQKDNDTLEDRIDTKLADKVDKTTFETLAGRVETNENAISGLQNLEQAYKDADAKIREDFAAADTALEGRVDGKLAGKVDKSTVEAIDNRLTGLEEGVIENEQVVAGVITDLNERLNNVNNEFAAADTALKNELNGEIAKKADSSVVTALAGRVETNESEITKLKGLEQAYKNADTKIREDFAAADTALKNELNGKLAGKANQSDFETLAGRVDVVQGTDTGKSMRTVAAEEAAKEVAKVVADADADFDTLKEIADWILNDKTGAAALQNDVAGLKDVVDGYTGKGAIKNVVEAIDNRLTELEEGVIENEEIVATALTDLDERLNNIPNEFAAADTALKNELNGEIAKKADNSVVTTLAGRVETNEGEITKLKGLEQAYKAADTKIREDFAAADTALKNELTTAINKKADAESVAAFDSRISSNASAITALQTADTKIREDFTKSDTDLKNELNGAIANKADKTTVEAIDNRLTNLEEGVIENEEITANLFAEMDTRIIELEAKLKDVDIDGGEF